MALFCGKVLMGKYAGELVDVTFLGDVKLGFKNVSNEVKSVSMVGSTTKTDLVFSLKPIKNYYHVQVVWTSGEESILEVNDKALQALNRSVR